MLLSIIIPVRNGGADFAVCLQALEAARSACRGLAETELIVVDDGSGDESSAAARAAGARLIALPARAAGHGPAFARNAGARAAKGDYLFFVDADVALQSNALRLAAEAFLADSSLEACFGSYDDTP